MSLPDPRLSPCVAPNHPLLHTVAALQAATTRDDVARLHLQLQQQITERLTLGDDTSLNVALQLAPTRDAYKTVWHTVIDIIGMLEVGHNRVFALPIVLVAGSTHKTTLPDRLRDPDALLAVLKQHGVVHPEAECTLLDTVVHPDSLGRVSLSQWYRATLPQLPACAVTVKDEAVFLRFLLGVAKLPHAPPLTLGGVTGEWAMPLMKIIGEQLATPGVTLFPIPLVPHVPPEALQQGLALRLDVGLQVVASNIIKKLRAHNLPIVAIASSHEGGELRFTFSTPGDTKNWAAYAWPLAPLDSVERITGSFTHLMAECQVDDIRFLPAIMPDTVDDMPLFITCNDAPGQHTIPTR